MGVWPTRAGSTPPKCRLAVPNANPKSPAIRAFSNAFPTTSIAVTPASCRPPPSRRYPVEPPHAGSSHTASTAFARANTHTPSRTPFVEPSTSCNEPSSRRRRAKRETVMILPTSEVSPKNQLNGEYDDSTNIAKPNAVCCRFASTGSPRTTRPTMNASRSIGSNVIRIVPCMISDS